MNHKYLIRPMTAGDLKQIFEWSDEEDWNECDQDLEPFMAIDPNGFFAAELDEKLIGGIAALKYGEYGFVGLYYIRKEFRSKGYGIPLCDQALKYLNDCEVVGADAAEAMTKAYEKWGFKFHYRSMGFQREAEGVMSDKVVDLKAVPVEELVKYDTQVFGYSRENFLKTLLKQDYYSLGVRKDGQLRGYGFLRKAHNGYRVGPLLADDKETAEEILNGLQSFIVGQVVDIDIFECNEDAKDIVTRQRWTYKESYYRMYAKGIPKMDVNRLFTPIVEVG